MIFHLHTLNIPKNFIVTLDYFVDIILYDFPKIPTRQIFSTWRIWE
jgi:hypothetical protein